MKSKFHHEKDGRRYLVEEMANGDCDEDQKQERESLGKEPSQETPNNFTHKKFDDVDHLEPPLGSRCLQVMDQVHCRNDWLLLLVTLVEMPDTVFSVCHAARKYISKCRMTASVVNTLLVWKTNFTGRFLRSNCRNMLVIA